MSFTLRENADPSPRLHNDWVQALPDSPITLFLLSPLGTLTSTLASPPQAPHPAALLFTRR